MDLRLTPMVARSVAIWTLNAMGAFLLLWATDSYGFSHESDRDYVLAGEVRGGLIVDSSALQSAGGSNRKSTGVQYRAFDGQTYTLTEHQGRYITLLLPQSGVTMLTSDHIEELVDRLDILYVLYREILHYEPKGSGKLNVAFVTQTCGSGCGLIGGKGIEIQSSQVNYEKIIQELDAGRLETLLVHEMVHNFDAYYSYLHYLPDHAHAWTDMFEFFAPYRYARDTSKNEAPDDIFNSPVRSVWKEYVTADSANWETCVRDQACEERGLSANNLWAMLYYRIETLHGVDALLGSFEFIADYASKNTPPKTGLEKEGLRILSLAVGAGTNIACYMDALKWPVTSEVRSELQTRFGGESAFCADLDNDGFSAVNGDCDDGNASRNILSDEIAANGLDDDCDDLVDEVNLVEADRGQDPDNFTAPVQTRMPYEVRGSASDSEDIDTFVFDLTPSKRARVTLCATSQFRGWAVALQPDGKFLESPNWYAYQPAAGCSSNTFDYADFETAGLAMMADESQGDYRITVSEASALPKDLSNYLQVAPLDGGGVLLSIDDRDQLLENLGTDELEFWVSDTGTHLFKAFAPGMAVALTAANAPELENGEIYQVRMRPRSNGMPLAAFSPGHLFRFESGADTFAQIDDSLSGAWFDSKHEGEGFIVEVLEDDTALVYWFTYHDDGRQRWFFGVGDVIGNRIVIENLMDAQGGQFGKNFDPDEVVLRSRGSLSMAFLGCQQAIVNYSVDNNGGHQQVTRLTNIYGHTCGSSDTAPEQDLSGSWYDPSHEGEGFIVEQTGPGQALVFWFTYDATGEQTWLLNTGTVQDGSITFTELLRPLGGKFGRSFDPQSVEHMPWGELELQLDCAGGSASYSADAPGFSNGSQSLVPLTRLQNSGCVR
jgi:hypothetical protein